VDTRGRGGGKGLAVLICLIPRCSLVHDFPLQGYRTVVRSRRTPRQELSASLVSLAARRPPPHHLLHVHRVGGRWLVLWRARPGCSTS
jgi:hypothetical protein